MKRNHFHSNMNLPRCNMCQWIRMLDDKYHLFQEQAYYLHIYHLEHLFFLFYNKNHRMDLRILILNSIHLNNILRILLQYNIPYCTINIEQNQEMIWN